MMLDSSHKNNLKDPMDLEVSSHENFDQYYYGHGKVLLSGEYFILDGAQGVALPTKLGQSMAVKYRSSFSPKLVWKSYDSEGNLWFESEYEFWRFDCLDENPSEEALFLQKLLRQAREQNKHFLRDNTGIQVETRLDFPLNWGLGSSSTLIYNIAQWAYISPFELAFNTYGGSGYDIACAQSEGPILYSKEEKSPHWSTVQFNPTFKDNLYFIYLGNKQNSREAIGHYDKKRPFTKDLLERFSKISEGLLESKSLAEFEELIIEHESLISEHLDLETVKERCFKDFWGEVKSLGAWGGDFIIATSLKSKEETVQYFNEKGHQTVLLFDELIRQSFTSLPIQQSSHETLQ